MKIRIATLDDINILAEHDIHICRRELENIIKLKRIYIAEAGGEFAGWLRYNLFWDNTPFMNMLYLLEEHRGKGYGKCLVEYWEQQMKAQGYEVVMTSTASDEYAQHFYVKLCYATVGGFSQTGEPYEIILSKRI